MKTILMITILLFSANVLGMGQNESQINHEQQQIRKYKLEAILARSNAMHQIDIVLVSALSCINDPALCRSDTSDDWGLLGRYLGELQLANEKLNEKERLSSPEIDQMYLYMKRNNHV